MPENEVQMNAYHTMSLSVLSVHQKEEEKTRYGLLMMMPMPLKTPGSPLTMPHKLQKNPPTAHERRVTCTTSNVTARRKLAYPETSSRHPHWRDKRRRNLSLRRCYRQRRSWRSTSRRASSTWCSRYRRPNSTPWIRVRAPSNRHKHTSRVLRVLPSIPGTEGRCRI